MSGRSAPRSPTTSTIMTSSRSPVRAGAPPRRVSFTWADDTISFELTPAPDGGTIFVLTEELSANHAARNAAGWDACRDPLTRGGDSDSWEPRFRRYVAAFEPILGHQDGPPEGYRAPG